MIRRSTPCLALSWLLASPLAAGAAADPPGLARRAPVRDAITLLDLWVEQQRAYRQLPGVVLGVVQVRRRCDYTLPLGR